MNAVKPRGPKRRWALSVVAIALVGGGAGPAAAWGPLTHATVDEAARRVLVGQPELSFLAHDPGRKAFLAASLVPDISFSIAAGGKTDAAMNRLLHDPEFARHCIGRAQGSRDEVRGAEALGILGHQEADAIGNAPDAITAAKTFGFSETTDVEGHVVRDPAASAAAQLAGVTAGLNKILIDALALDAVGGHVPLPAIEPVDTTALIDAIESYDGVAALPHATDAQRAQIEKSVTHEARQFQKSIVALRLLVDRIRANASLMDDLTAEFHGRGETIPGLDASVRRVVSAVLMKEIPPLVDPSATASAAATAPALAAPAGLPDDAWSDLQTVPRAPGSFPDTPAPATGLAFDPLIAYRKDVLGTVDTYVHRLLPLAARDLRLVSRQLEHLVDRGIGTIAGGSDALSRAKRRVMETFVLEIGLGRPWAEVKARVRAQVP